MLKTLFKYIAFSLGVILLSVIRVIPGVGDGKAPYDTASDLFSTPAAHADTPHGGGQAGEGCGGDGGDAGCGGDAGGSGSDAGDGCGDGPCSNF